MGNKQRAGTEQARPRLAMLGCGFVAPRHAQAAADNGFDVVLASDPHDSVGFLDARAPDCLFVKEERVFWELVKALEVTHIAVLTPNNLHIPQAIMALERDCEVIIEKPIAARDYELDSLEVAESVSRGRVHSVLQLRLDPQIIKLKQDVDCVAKTADYVHDIEIDYSTFRGPWFSVSWKSRDWLSGGVPMTIGIHLFDLVTWIFGPCHDVLRTRWLGDERRSCAGEMRLKNANVIWRLQTDVQEPAKRLITVDGVKIDFTSGIDLHGSFYESVIDGTSTGLSDARPSIELVSRVIRGLA